MRRRSSIVTIRAAATAVILSMAMAGAVSVGGAEVASAQDVVTTQGYTIGTGPVAGATAVAQPDAAGATADYTVGFTTPSALEKRRDGHTGRPEGGHGVPGRQGRLHRHRQHPVVG